VHHTRYKTAALYWQTNLSTPNS